MVAGFRRLFRWEKADGEHGQQGAGGIGCKIPPLGASAGVHGHLGQFDSSAKENHQNRGRREMSRSVPRMDGAHGVERPSPQESAHHQSMNHFVGARKDWDVDIGKRMRGKCEP